VEFTSRRPASTVSGAAFLISVVLLSIEGLLVRCWRLGLDQVTDGLALPETPAVRMHASVQEGGLGCRVDGADFTATSAAEFGTASYDFGAGQTGLDGQVGGELELNGADELA